MGVRGEELAGLYRKIADLQTELADAEARLERALAESAGADEMVGQMLARVGEAEGKLHEAEERASLAEERAGELARQRDEAQREVEHARAEAEAQREQTAQVSAKLSRAHDERQSLGLRVSELAKVCEERDGALLREELFEAELVAVRAEMVELRASHAAELAAAEARTQAASARVVGAAELSAAREARDALATEAVHLRAAVGRIGDVLSELTRSLAAGALAPPPAKPQDDSRHSSEPPEIIAVPSEELVTSEIPAHNLASLMDEVSEEDDATKVFGAREMELVRESARRSEPGPEPAGGTQRAGRRTGLRS
jgi:hypothetical protein